MTLRVLIYIGCLLVSMLTLSSCAITCINVPSADFVSKSFWFYFGQLTALSVKNKDVGNGYRQGQVDVKNNKSSNQMFKYRVSWFNKDGVLIGQPQPWTPVQLYPNLTKSIVFTSHSSDAYSYSVAMCRVN